MKQAIATGEMGLGVEKDLRYGSECSLIGAIIRTSFTRPYFPNDVFSICPPDCFKYPDTHALAEIVREFARDGKTQITLPALGRAINAAGTLAKFGGNRFLADVTTGAWDGDIATMREAVALAQEGRKEDAAVQLESLLRDCKTFGGAPADMIAANLRPVLEFLLESPGAQTETLDDQLDRYLEALAGARILNPTPSPWRDVTGILRGGILPGELAVLAARPSVGKSAFALNWALSVASSGKQSIMFSLEMSEQQLFNRMIANIGSIDVGCFRKGLSEQQRKQAQGAATLLRTKRLVVRDKPSVTLSDIRRGIRQAQQRGPVGLVAIDYLQLMQPEQRCNSREREVAEMSRSLKLMAKELQVPVLLLAQLNRESEKSNRDPLMSDLRESGAIEQDADIVMFLAAARRDSDYHDEPVQVIVAKGRDSGVGKCSLMFHRLYQRFIDSSDAEFFKVRKAERSAMQELPELA